MSLLNFLLSQRPYFLYAIFWDVVWTLSLFAVEILDLFTKLLNLQKAIVENLFECMNFIDCD